MSVVTIRPNNANINALERNEDGFMLHFDDEPALESFFYKYAFNRFGESPNLHKLAEAIFHPQYRHEHIDGRIPAAFLLKFDGDKAGVQFSIPNLSSERYLNRMIKFLCDYLEEEHFIRKTDRAEIFEALSQSPSNDRFNGLQPQ